MIRAGHRRLRAIAAAVTTAALVALSPTGAVFADSAGPTDYETMITRTSVDVSNAVRFDVEGSDAFVRATVARGHELIVLGYDGEEYLWITDTGAVFENHNSETYYYNLERYGGEVPDDADSAAEPVWVQVDGDGEHAWHDHRAHWMADSPLVGMRPGDSFPPEDIEVIVDGRPVTVTVVTTLRESATLWWPVVGAIAAAAVIVVIALLAGQRRRRVWMVGLGAATIAFVVGLAQFGALPPSTGPSWAWWGVPAVAIATFGAAGWIRGTAPGPSMALVAAGGVELAVWALQRGDGLLAAYRPTVLPVGLDRAATVALGLIGGALTIVSLVAMRPRSQPTGS